MPLEKAAPQVLFLPLGTPEAGVSLQGWLYESLRGAILGGRLPAGSKLPSTRAMAEHYGLARGTVQAAYQQLLSEGYLQAVSYTHLDVYKRQPGRCARPCSRGRVGAAR